MGRREKSIPLADMSDLSIGQSMRLSRQSKSISLSDMANLLGYTRGYLSMIENGHKQPPLDLVVSYERVLGLESGRLSQVLESPRLVEGHPEHPSDVAQVLEHWEILSDGVNFWNQWREANPNTRPFLARAKFSGANLEGSNLSGADLTRAVFSEAKLNKADLSESVLRQTFLQGAELSGASLSRAYLKDAKLYGANLSEANLSEANLSGADLGNCDLSGANLSEANLSGANLSEANLSGADLTRTNITSASLDMTNLVEAVVSNTIFGDVDLSRVTGLEAVRHTGPSVIGLDTILRSQAKISEVFLRRAGVSETIITYIRSLVTPAIEYYTCFMSYSGKDEDFARKLHDDLRERGIRCWFAPDDLIIGDKFVSRIDESVKLSDKFIVILSENSISSSWVGREVEVALEKESQQKRDVLYPIRLDNAALMASNAWIADLRRTRHIGDFTKWKEPEAYQQALRRLLRDLNALPRSASILNKGFRAEAAVDKWLRVLNISVEQQRETSIPDFVVTDKDGNKVGVEVKYYSQPQRVREKKWRDYYKYLESKQKDYEKLLMVAVFPDESDAEKGAINLNSIAHEVPNVTFTAGYIQDNEFIPINVFRS
jgi:transcriptional regulator with XRE-family HTH domain